LIGRGRFQIHFGIGERWAWLSALAYGVANILLRVSAAHMDPWLGALLRLLPTAALAWFVLARTGFPELRRGDARYMAPRLVAYLFIGGLISYVIGNVLLFRAFADGGLAIGVNALQGGSVWAGVIFGAVLLHDRPRREQLIGAAVIAGGLAVIAVSQLSNPGQLWFQGLLFAIGAGSCYSLTNVFTRTVQRQRPTVYAALAFSAAGGLIPLGLIALGRMVVDPAGMLTGLRAYDVAVILIMGVVNILAMTGVTQALRHTTVGTVSSIGSASIAVSFLASIFLFTESVSLLMAAGVIVVIAGILVGQAGRRAIPAEATVSASAAASTPPAVPPVAPAPKG
jgi:O-acetylserine/cysteine efflux transporter